MINGWVSGLCVIQSEAKNPGSFFARPTRGEADARPRGGELASTLNLDLA